MSQTKKAAMAKQAAFNIVANEIYNPVFFAKLAEFGIVPRNEAEAAQLLKTASEARVLATQVFGSIDTVPPSPEVVKELSKVIDAQPRIKSAALILAYNS